MKYQKAQDIINAFKTEEGKQEFLIEWNYTPNQVENHYLKTIRYKVIEGYFNSEEGYDEVLTILENNDIKLLRNRDLIYALNDKDLNDKIEELFLFLRSKKLLVSDFYFSKKYLETEAGKKEKSEKINDIRKLASSFSKHPNIFGKLLEADLTYGAYLLEDEDTFLELIKNSNQAPYSSNNIKEVFKDIALDSNLVLYKKIKHINPNYIKEISKTAFNLTHITFPQSIVSFGRNEGKKTHNISVNFLSFAQQHSDSEFFSFVLKSSDFPLDGEVQSCYTDISQSLEQQDRNLLKMEWGRNRYNLYKTQGEKYSRGDYIPHKNANVLFNVFSEYLDQGFEAEDYDKPYDEIKGKAEIPNHFNDYLNETIRNGTFIKQIFSKVSSWHANERGQLKLNGDNILKGYESAIEILLQIKNAREIIYGLAEKIITNEKDPLLKSEFLNNLIKHAYHLKQFDIDNKSEPFNPLWTTGKNQNNIKESLNYILENYVVLMPKVLTTTEHKDSSHHLVILNSKVTHISEQENITKAMITLGQNSIFATPSYIFKEKNVLNNKTFNIILNSDLSNNGKNNPLEMLLRNNEIGENKKSFFSNDEEREKHDKLRIENNENKISQYSKNISKIIKKASKDKTILIPIKEESIYSEYKKNLISIALDKCNLGGLLLMKSLKKENIQQILNGDLYGEDIEKIYRDINNSLFTSLNSSVILNHDVNIDEKNIIHRMLEETISKLHETNFEFHIKIDSNQDALKYMKLFAIIQNKDLLTSLYKKYETEIGETVKKFSYEQFINNNYSDTEFILNSFQNEELFNLFAEKRDISKIEPIISSINSQKLYSIFLNNTKYDLSSDVLLRAVQSHKYKTALAIIESNPNTITTMNSNKRSVLEIAIRDLSSFSSAKGKYYSPENKIDVTAFIKTIIHSETPICNDKKVLLNLLETIGKIDVEDITKGLKECSINNSDMLILSKKLIIDNMDVVAKKAGIGIDDNTDNSSEFKI